MKRLLFLFIVFFSSCKEGEITIEPDRNFAEISEKEFGSLEFQNFGELQDWLFANADRGNLTQSITQGGETFFEIGNARLDFSIVQCFDLDVTDDLGADNLKLLIANNVRVIDPFDDDLNDIDILYVAAAFDVFSSGVYSDNRIQVSLQNNADFLVTLVESGSFNFQIADGRYSVSFSEEDGRVVSFGPGDSFALPNNNLSGVISCF